MGLLLPPVQTLAYTQSPWLFSETLPTQGIVSRDEVVDRFSLEFSAKSLIF